MISAHLSYVRIHIFYCIKTFGLLFLNIFQDLFTALWNLPQKLFSLQLLFIILLAKIICFYGTLFLIWRVQFLIRYFVKLALDGWILRDFHIFIAWDLTYTDFMRFFFLFILVYGQSFTDKLFILISWTLLWYLFGLKAIINAIKKRVRLLFLKILKVEVDLGRDGLMIVGGLEVEGLELGSFKMVGTDRVARVEMMMVGWWERRRGLGEIRIFEQDGLDSFQIIINGVNCSKDWRVLYCRFGFYRFNRNVRHRVSYRFQVECDWAHLN